MYYVEEYEHKHKSKTTMMSNNRTAVSSLAGENKMTIIRSKEKYLPPMNGRLLRSLFTIPESAFQYDAINNHEIIGENKEENEEEEHLRPIPIIMHVGCLGRCKYIVHHQQETAPNENDNERRRLSTSLVLSQQQIRKLHHRFSRWDTDSTSSGSGSASTSTSTNTNTNTISINNDKSVVQQQIRKLHHRISRWDTDSTSSSSSTSTSTSTSTINNDESVVMPQQQQQRSSSSRNSIDYPPILPVRQKSISTYMYQNGNRVVSISKE